MLNAIDQPRTSLWDLEQQLVELIEFRDAAETEEEKAAADLAISEYVTREVTKVDNIRAYMRHCEVMAAGAKEEKLRQAERQQGWERRLDVLKESVKRTMESIGKTKLEGKTGHFQIKASGGKLPIIIDDELLIPSSFCDYVKTPRKGDVLKALEAGEEVPGARLGERGKRLEVK